MCCVTLCMHIFVICVVVTVVLKSPVAKLCLIPNITHVIVYTVMALILYGTCLQGISELTIHKIIKCIYLHLLKCRKRINSWVSTESLNITSGLYVLRWRPNQSAAWSTENSDPHHHNIIWNIYLRALTEQPVNSATSSPHCLSQQQFMSHWSSCSSQGHTLLTDTHNNNKKDTHVTTCYYVFAYIAFVF